MVACGPDSASALPSDSVADAEATSTTGPIDTSEPFVIGGLDSLTGVGESYGDPPSRSKLLAVVEINTAGAG